MVHSSIPLRTAFAMSDSSTARVTYVMETGYSASDAATPESKLNTVDSSLRHPTYPTTCEYTPPRMSISSWFSERGVIFVRRDQRSDPLN